MVLELYLIGSCVKSVMSESSSSDGAGRFIVPELAAASASLASFNSSSVRISLTLGEPDPDFAFGPSP